MPPKLWTCKEAETYDLVMPPSTLIVPPAAAVEMASNEVICGRSHWRFSDRSTEGRSAGSGVEAGSGLTLDSLMSVHSTQG